MSLLERSLTAVAYSLGDAMDSAVPHRLDPETAARPPVTARADKPEGVAVERVAADPATYHAGLASDDDDRVEHERKARLRRWQAVGR